MNVQNLQDTMPQLSDLSIKINQINCLDVKASLGINLDKNLPKLKARSKSFSFEPTSAFEGDEIKNFFKEARKKNRKKRRQFHYYDNDENELDDSIRF